MTAIVQDWIECLESAWAEARGRRLASLHGRYSSGRDGRGLDAFSCEVGRIIALQKLEPVLLEAEFDAVLFRRAAEDDALDTFKQELREESDAAGAA